MAITKDRLPLYGLGIRTENPLPGSKADPEVNKIIGTYKNLRDVERAQRKHPRWGDQEVKIVDLSSSEYYHFMIPRIEVAVAPTYLGPIYYKQMRLGDIARTNLDPYSMKR